MARRVQAHRKPFPRISEDWLHNRVMKAMHDLDNDFGGTIIYTQHLQSSTLRSFAHDVWRHLYGEQKRRAKAKR